MVVFTGLARPVNTSGRRGSMVTGVAVRGSIYRSSGRRGSIYRVAVDVVVFTG